MAFIGLVFGTLVIVVLICLAGLTLLSFFIALILKITGKVRNKKGLKTAGTVFIVLGTVFALPLLFVAGYAAFVSAFIKVELPNGKRAYELRGNYKRLVLLAEDGGEDALLEMDLLLDKHPNLAYIRDANRRSILEYGMEDGNAGLVKLAIEHGLVFDDPSRYDRMAYVKSSMEEFMGGLYSREITSEDITIIELMFDQEASTELYLPHGAVPGYSNIFGEAVWLIMYNNYENDLEITDNDLEFLRVFMDNGYTRDPELIPVGEVPSNYLFPEGYYKDIKEDANYGELMRITGLA